MAKCKINGLSYPYKSKSKDKAIGMSDIGVKIEGSQALPKIFEMSKTLTFEWLFS